MTIRIAIGQRIDRSTVAVLGGEVRGANAFSRPVRMESGSATSAPYTDRLSAASRRAERVGRGHFATVQVADDRRQRARRVNDGAVSDALPDRPLAGGACVDHGRGDGRD